MIFEEYRQLAAMTDADLYALHCHLERSTDPYAKRAVILVWSEMKERRNAIRRMNRGLKRPIRTCTLT